MVLTCPGSSWKVYFFSLPHFIPKANARTQLHQNISGKLGFEEGEVGRGSRTSKGLKFGMELQFLFRSFEVLGTRTHLGRILLVVKGIILDMQETCDQMVISGS